MGALISFLTLFLPSRLFLPKLHFAPVPIRLAVKQREDPPLVPTSDDSVILNTGINFKREKDGGDQLVSLKTFVESRVPSLRKPFKPSWWLPTGHVQTAYCVLADFDTVDPVVYKRTLLRLPDGGTLGLDFTPPVADQDMDPATPVIVVLHGLSGGSQESYVRSILGTACAPKDKGGLGYRAVVVNFRGCAGVPLTTPQFYSAGHTDDIRSALLYLSSKYPRAPLLGVGFSLGANVLARYLGEEGQNSRLKAGCVLACPWNLTANSPQLEGRFLNREIYSRAMGRNVLALLAKHAPAIHKMPPSLLSEFAPKALALKRPTLKEVDEHMVRICGGSSPPFPFPTADAYYEWAGGHHKLAEVRVPLLAVNALDDPIVAEVPFEICSKNPWVCLATTKYGGHLGWFEGPLFGRKGIPPHRWIKKPVLEWFAAICDISNNLGAGSGVNVGNPREIKDGFVMEAGHPFVGYKVLKTGMGINRDNLPNLLKGL